MIRPIAHGVLGAASGGGSVSLPATNIYLHLDARLGVTTASGDVSAWADQSGNGNDFAQTTPSARPAFTATKPSLGDQAAVTFDGVGDWMLASLSASGAGPRTAYFVGDFAVADGSYILDIATARAIYLNRTGFHAYYDGGYRVTSRAFDTGAHSFTYQQDGGTFSTRVDGGAAVTAATGGDVAIVATTAAALGGRFSGTANFGAMDLAAAFIYDGAHDDAGVLAYIAQEWGV